MSATCLFCGKAAIGLVSRTGTLTIDDEGHLSMDIYLCPTCKADVWAHGIENAPWRPVWWKE